jgi:hypothetical protein
VKIRAWFNVGEKDPEKVWVVQEEDKTIYTAPSVEFLGPCLTRYEAGKTPSGWIESYGWMLRDGVTNGIIIRIP